MSACTVASGEAKDTKDEEHADVNTPRVSEQGYSGNNNNNAISTSATDDGWTVVAPRKNKKAQAGDCEVK